MGWQDAPVESAKPAWADAPEDIPAQEPAKPLTFGRTLLGEAQLLGSGAFNSFHLAEAGATDVKRRLLSQDRDAPINTFFPEVHPGEAGRDVISSINEFRNPDAVDEGALKQDSIKQQFGAPNETVQDVVGHIGKVGEDVGAILPIVGGAKSIVSGVRNAVTTSAEAAANAPSWAKAGYRTPDAHKIAAGIDREGGKAALGLNNQKITDTLSANDAGVKPGAALNYESLKAGREAPDAVYARAAAGLPTAPTFSPAARAIIEKAGEGKNRISQGSPQSAQAIAKLRSELLDKVNVTGQESVTELRGLRQEGYKNIASDDVSNQHLGQAQLDAARGIEQHISDTLPPTAGTSLEQLQAARTALAKNHAVQEALRGNTVDAAVIARMQRANPELLTGGLKTIAEFANEHPTHVTLGSRIDAPNFQSDIGKSIGGSAGEHTPENVIGSIARLFGVKAGARRILAGDLEANVAKANAASPPRNPLDLAPQISTQKLLPPASGTPPIPGDIVNAGGGAATNSLLDELGMTSDVQRAQQAHPGMARPGAPEAPVADRPLSSIAFREPENWSSVLQANGPVPAATAGGEGYPLSAVLSGGVEQRPASGLSLAPEGAPPPSAGVPFTRDAGQMAGDLSLMDEIGAGPRENLSDVAGVRSQGVPEGTLMRSPGNTANMRLGDIVDMKPTKRTNNASGESSASVEAINRTAQEGKLGRGRYVVDSDGKATKLRGVDSADAKAPKGSIIIQKGIGAEPFSILDRGGLAPAHARGLMNRAVSLGDLLGQ